MRKIKGIRKKGTVVNVSGQAKKLTRQIIATNAMLTRSQLMTGIDPRRNINAECGYPEVINTSDYQIMYDREGMATRAVNVYPEESWVVDPIIEENNKPEESEFEKAWEEIQDLLQIYSVMNRADEISGIGRYGIILLGFNDGKELKQSLDGIDEKGNKTGNSKWELMYLRPFSESAVTIKATEQDMKNPRFGKPILYTIKFQDVTTDNTTMGDVNKIGVEILVHWTRVIHVADNRKSSEVFGVPRMQILFNRLYDIRKIAGGSGEMFWKGGFPGISFELDANAKALTPAQKTELTTEIAAYANGLQRYLTTQGVQANSLTPQVADPKNHVDVMITIISIALGVPKRIFQGSEAAKLASSQDTITWNKRVSKRQNKYLSPYIIKPLIDRLILAGAIPEPKDNQYSVIWPDLNSPSDLEKADVLAKRVKAFSEYVGGNVDALIPPEIFFKLFTELTADEIKEIKNASLKHIREMDDGDEEMRKKAEEEAKETDEDQTEDAPEQNTEDDSEGRE